MPAAFRSAARWWCATRARRSRSRRRPTTGRWRCTASAGCAICAPPTPASPAPMPARWSTNGFRCNAPGDAAARRPEVTARRIISWISQAPLVLDDSDVRFYRRFLRSLTRQVRQLRHTAADARDGVPRLLVDDRADVRVAVHGQPGAPHQGRRQAPDRRARPADPARRRPHQPQSRRADRAPGRPAAAAARCSPPATCRRRRR